MNSQVQGRAGHAGGLRPPPRGLWSAPPRPGCPCGQSWQHRGAHALRTRPQRRPRAGLGYGQPGSLHWLLQTEGQTPLPEDVESRGPRDLAGLRVLRVAWGGKPMSHSGLGTWHRHQPPDPQPTPVDPAARRLCWRRVPECATASPVLLCLTQSPRRVSENLRLPLQGTAGPLEGAVCLHPQAELWGAAGCGLGQGLGRPDTEKTAPLCGLAPARLPGGCCPHAPWSLWSAACGADPVLPSSVARSAL